MLSEHDEKVHLGSPEPNTGRQQSAKQRLMRRKKKPSRPGDQTQVCVLAIALYLVLCFLVIGPLFVYLRDRDGESSPLNPHTYNTETFDEVLFSEEHLVPFLDSLDYGLKNTIQTRCVFWVQGPNSTSKSCYYVVGRAWGSLSSPPPTAIQQKSTPAPQEDCGARVEDICQAELATQCSVDRIHRLEDLLREWDGVISVSIYTTDPVVELAIISNFFSSCGCLCKYRITAHLVVGSPNSPYPINVMRNLAMDSGFTETVDLICMYDVDFVPSLGLCGALVHWSSVLETKGDELIQNQGDFSRLLERRSEMKGRRELLLVPSFEVSHPERAVEPKPRKGRKGRGEESVLTFLFGDAKKNGTGDKEEKKDVEEESSQGSLSVKTKEGLLPHLETGQIKLFHAPFEGQLLNLTFWNSSNTPYIHTNIRLLNEHYVWFSRSTYTDATREPLCDEFFFDRGYNKIMCYLQLRLNDFYPVAIPDGFLIHALEGDGKVGNEKLFEGELSSLNITKKGKARKPMVQYRPTGPFYKTLLHVRFCEKVKREGWDEKVPFCAKFCSSLQNLSYSIARGELRNCYHRIGTFQGIEKGWKPVRTFLERPMRRTIRARA